MVLSCLRGYHLRCLRPSLFPDSQPLVERDEIIAVLQNSLSLFLSFSVLISPATLPCVFLKAYEVLFGTNNYHGRFYICTLSYNWQCILQQQGRVSDEHEMAYSYSDKYS